MTDVKSQVSGIVAAIEVQTGSAVEADQIILLIESMKMEIPIEAERAGILAELLVEEGESVTEGQVVARLREG